MNFYIYDLETMINQFLFTGKFFGRPEIYTFEISPRMNQLNELLMHLNYLQNCKVHMVGYNSLNFDYPILHHILNNAYTTTYQSIYLKAQEIVNTRFGGFNPHSVRMSDRIIPQIDLMKVHHFDNATKATTLKALQFAMRLESVEDMPVPHGTPLTFEQMDLMRGYNVHDVTATETFLVKSLPAIKIREDLITNGVLSGDVLNYSDVKIGTEYLVRKIGRSKCYVGSKPRQTHRTQVELRSCILPKIEFRSEHFGAVRSWFEGQTIYTGSDERPKLKAELAGLEFIFGLGGVHASASSKVFETTATHIIKDIDVGGMYPAVAIANGFAPEHLGADFSLAYKQMSADRKNYHKGTSMNLVLKLANNGAFGNSGSDYSPLLDLKFLYSITVNGQLQLLQLVELLSMIPGLQLIQANTDGITALVPRECEQFFNLWCGHWEQETGLKLEYADYKKMWIRDVNNYLAVDMQGKIKRKGAYWYPETDADYWGGSGSNWNKDFSNMAVKKAIEQVHLKGVAPADIIRLLNDPFDFMLRYKTQGGATVYIGDKAQLKTVRYYVSTAGQPMRKVTPAKGVIGEFKRKNGITDAEYIKVKNEIALGAHDERIHTKNKSVYAPTSSEIEKGWLVKQCNHVRDFNWKDVDYDYYVEEIEKLRIQ